MKLSDIKNEQAMEVLADLIDPVMRITANNDFESAMKSGNLLGAVKVALKNNSKDVIEILARLDGIEVDKYECSIVTLPARLIELLNEKEILDFFGYASQQTEKESSGSATENIEETDAE